MNKARYVEIANMLGGREQHGYGVWHRALVDCLKANGEREEDLPEASNEMTERQWRTMVGREFRHVKLEEEKPVEEEKAQ